MKGIIMNRIVMYALLSISFCTIPTFLQCKSVWQCTKEVASFLLVPPDIVTKDTIYSGTSLWFANKKGVDVLGNPQKKK
jgi:hypothetical protein